MSLVTIILFILCIIIVCLLAYYSNKADDMKALNMIQNDKRPRFVNRRPIGWDEKNPTRTLSTDEVHMTVELGEYIEYAVVNELLLKSKEIK